MSRDVTPVPKQGPRPKAKRKPLSHVTVKSAALVEAERDVRLRSGGRCEAQTPWCEHRATQVHHRAGRTGFARNDDGDVVSVDDPTLLLDVCGMGNVTGCHGYIHQNSDESRLRGWMVSRLRQVTAHVRDAS